MKLPTSIENILNENIVENARLELKRNWNPEPNGFEDEKEVRPRTDQEPTKIPTKIKY
mgnify:CR=1 FL=1